VNLRYWFTLTKEAVTAWSNDYAPSMGAALSYYTLFSIAPLLLIAISVAGFLFGEQAARGEIFEQLRGLMGEDGAGAVEQVLQNANRPATGGLAAAVGVVVLLAGASSVFSELQNDLDRIWRVPLHVKRGAWNMLRTRLLSFGMVLGMSFLLIVSLLVSALLAALGKWWAPFFGAWVTVAHAADLLFSFALMSAMFATLYKIMPRAYVRWRDVWIGAGVTAALFAVGKFAIGLYLGRSTVASAFGAAGSLAVVMVWVYYSAQIFLLGAEFTRVYAYSHGSMQAIPSAAPTPLKEKPVVTERASVRPMRVLGAAAMLGALAALIRRRHSD
jgi:membrane protein